jgi:hypothetical protein
MSDPRFFRKYLDILNEAPPAPVAAKPAPAAPAATPAKPAMANMPGAANYDVLSGEKAALAQTTQNISAERGARVQAANGKGVNTTDLGQQQKQALQDYSAASKEKLGGGFWSKDASGAKTYTATPTKAGVIQQGLQGVDYGPQTVAQAIPKTPQTPGTVIQSATTDQSGLTKTPQTPGTIPSATPEPVAPPVTTPQQPVQEDELVRLKDLLKR